MTGYLNRAAYANTIELADKELGLAIAYLEANNMTSGSTAVFYETPSRDIGFWYENLKASQQELQNLEVTTALEKTNVLMKLRETLMTQGEKSKVRIPKGLDVYPYNGMWVALGWAAFFALITGFLMFIPAEEWEKAKKQQQEKALS